MRPGQILKSVETQPKEISCGKLKYICVIFLYVWTPTPVMFHSRKRRKWMTLNIFCESTLIKAKVQQSKKRHLILV